MPSGSLEMRTITVRCGKCEACLLERQMMWRIRLNEEFRACESAIFFTLTYDQDHLPVFKHDPRLGAVMDDPLREEELLSFDLPSRSRLRTARMRQLYNRPVKRLGDVLFDGNIYYPTVCKRDVQLFLKRLRKRLEPFKVRYFICSEYGPETHRPHYHGIIFNYPYDRNLSKEKVIIEVEKALETAWKNGFVRADLCNGARCNYCAKYCVKPSDAVSIQSAPPFILCSRRPAIGAAYLDRHDRVDWHILKHSTEYVAPSFNKSNKLFKTKLPKYYVDRIFVDPTDRKVLSLYQRLKRLFRDDLEFADIFDIDDLRYIEEEQRQETERLLDMFENFDEYEKKAKSKEEQVHRLVRKAHKGGQRSKNV